MSDDPNLYVASEIFSDILQDCDAGIAKQRESFVFEYIQRTRSDIPRATLYLIFDFFLFAKKYGKEGNNKRQSSAS